MEIAMNAARFFASVVLAGAVLVVGGGPVGCADEGSGTTTGRRISLEVKIAASPGSKQFTNTQGWNVTITKAAIATGALYFYDGDTLFAGAERTGRSWALVKTAFAHPGHYVPGNAKGQMLTPSSADLLAGAVLGRGDGVSGPVRSATFSFGAPATGPAAAELGADVIVLEGSATKAAETRRFRAEILPDEMKDAKGMMQIEGCPFTAADMQSDGVVSIEISLARWFDQVTFDDVPTSANGEPVVLPNGLARNQLVRGAKAGLAYTFAYARR
jgi:hypothetical protein